MFQNRYARIAFVILGAALACQVAEAQPTTKKGSTGFNAGCASPSFPAPPPKVLQAIDLQCALAGQPNEPAPEVAQNKAKNNFCATPPANSSITVADMIKMQQDVESDKTINFGGRVHPLSAAGGPTTDRTPLKAMGEGQQRVLQGFVLIARQEGKEAVNCGPTFPDKTETMDHDIHISIVGDVSQVHGNECESIVAEMSPHHRPDSWTAKNVQLVATKHLPVRVTGQLFFDSSHSPCVDGKSEAGDPHRSSLWELHPIYKFEVCSSGTCAGDTGWQSLDLWITKNGTSTNASNNTKSKK
jgi:hypothetical protein